MQKRTPKFDINLATVQLLLAQFKHARAGPADVEPWPPVQLWKPTSLLHHFQSTFDWISAINKAGYAIPSQYLEEFGKFLEGYARCVRIPTKERRSPLQNVRWGSKMAAIYSLHMAWTARPLSYICWFLRYGLEQCLSPDALDRLECQYTNIAGGANLLLSAAIYKRVDFVRSLLGKGHTPNESVSVLLSDLRRTDPPVEYRTTTVWFIFLWYFVDTLLRDRNISVPSLVLEEFLDCGNVDCDVQFVICSSSLSTSQYKELEIGKGNPTQNDSKEAYAISLLRVVELRNLPNVETLKIRESNPWWSWSLLGTKLAPWVKIQSRRDYLDPRCRGLTAKDIRPKSDLYLDTIVTKTDRLDAPFSFILS